MLFRFTLIIIITFLGYFYSFFASESNFIFTKSHLLYSFYAFCIGFFFISIEIQLHSVKINKIIFSTLSCVIALLFGYLFSLMFQGWLNPFILTLFQIGFLYLGFILSWIKEEEFLNYFKDLYLNPDIDENQIVRVKILDTSVIIDGRIIDIAETGFIEGVFILPKFVLNELQMVADSSDPLKRNRGRRGLDILNKIKTSKKVLIKITDIDFPEIQEVDAKLLKLAKKYKNAVIITNDFNLNKVAELEGISILNINELTSSVKPVLLPNEELKITIIKEGKDQNQGIAYLEDGTMIVVDNGKNYIGKEATVVVNSILQTSAGRMIFTQIINSKEKYNYREKDYKNFINQNQIS